ncbi:hypothetical protein ASG40_05920 [Methylobacterium sp. Leaf399]|uniref:PRC-barrel domain-containing protein n=1 Tax=Methylobacterium sp. Leaf399 TaxID=1736364 RepID=UPI0006FA4C39|nr:PRC-barrel domain-containing protein [Methylobacterium sp. Leaf399]KQT14839.1 hypothetical protein ASG40_05920 [Methylobacterium sp. Leaf399]
MTHLSRSGAIALLVAVLASAPAFAEPGGSAATFLTARSVAGMPASKLIGLDVIGMGHERVGRIEEIVLDANGHAKAVVIGVGGFLGIGEKRVAVPFDQMVWNGVATSGDPARSSTTPADAPNVKAADTAGPQTMPGSQISNDVLTVIDEKRGGGVNEATGSVTATDTSRGRATVAVPGSGDGPVRAEIRATKAMLQEAPAFDATGTAGR